MNPTLALFLLTALAPEAAPEPRVEARAGEPVLARATVEAGRAVEPRGPSLVRRPVLGRRSPKTPVHPSRQLANVLGQDWSWYPHAERLPFVGALVEEDSSDVVWAGNAVFTVGDPPDVPKQLWKRADAGDFAPGWFLVHFEGPVRRKDKLFLDRLTGSITRDDGTPLSRWYLPNDTLAAWLSEPSTLEALEESPRIDWVGRYQPAYKLDPTIGAVQLRSPERVGRKSYLLNVDLVPGHDADDVAEQVERRGAKVVERVHLRGAKTHDVRFLVVEAPPSVVTDLALVEGIRLIQEHPDGVRLHDFSGGGKVQARTLTTDDSTASPNVTSATFPLWVDHDLQGQGQLIGVVDTSFDWNNTGTNGCDVGFPDTAIDNYGFALPNLAEVLVPAVGTGGVNLKIPLADLLGGATLLGIANREHGVGVAGAALADFYGNDDTKWWEHDVDEWESWSPSNFSGLLGPGIAHEAQLYATPVMDDTNTFRWESPGEFETHMATTLSNMAAAGAATSVHSTGLLEANDTYTQVSVVHDTEAYDHPMLLQCAAAGNDGEGIGKLSSQAVVKNVLTVGASDDVLKPEDRTVFSSTGPRFDGGLKPDVMAPGDDSKPRATEIVSNLILPDSNGSSSASCEYQWTSGTSFAAPIAAGAGALVHQYFEEGRYPGNTQVLDPSAALMKAMLVNSGHRLSGFRLGDGTYPNDYQGWGEINLMDVLDFGTGPRQLIAIDVPSASGFSSGGDTSRAHAFRVTGATERLRVTLVWTDEPGTVGGGKKLINDLDLRVTSPGGTTWLGNVFDGAAGTSVPGGAADTLNNVENVILAAPELGNWSATVDPGSGNYADGQGYALVITGDVAELGIPSAPVADFSATPTAGTAPLSVSFTDLSTGTVASRSWDFGDGGTSMATNPTHVYADPGTYDVSLTVTGPGGADVEEKLSHVTVDEPSGTGLYYLSFLSTTVVPGLGKVRDEDVVTYDPATDQWAMHFDGSDVGIGGTDVAALHVRDDGTLLLSFDKPFDVPGLVGGPSGTSVDDSDLILFHPTGTGGDTAGTFEFHFDGSDVLLTTNGEDIDGVHEFADGTLAISTRGGINIGTKGKDEDVFLFTDTQLGATTAGTWSVLFDGSDVGFANGGAEDLDGLHFENATNMLFSTVGTYSAAGGAGDDEDVSRFNGTFGASTSGTASLILDLSAAGIDVSEDVNALSFVP